MLLLRVHLSLSGNKLAAPAKAMDFGPRTSRPPLLPPPYTPLSVHRLEPGNLCSRHCSHVTMSSCNTHLKCHWHPMGMDQPHWAGGGGTERARCRARWLEGWWIGASG